ncbi:MAG: GAF domain-containing protein [Pseudomonadales bacterium]
MIDAKLLIRAERALADAPSASEVQIILCRFARRLTGADGATFVVRDGDLCRYLAEDAIEPLWAGQSFPMAHCISGWSMLRRSPAFIADVFADPRVPQEAYRPTFVKSLAMVPIRQTNPIGAMGTYWAPGNAAGPDSLEPLQALADLASVALARLDSGIPPAAEPSDVSDEDRCRNLYEFVRLRLGGEVSDREIARRWGMNWRSFLNLKEGSRRVPRLEELEDLGRLLDVDAALVVLVARGEPAEVVNRWLLKGEEAVRRGLLTRLAVTPGGLAGALPTSIERIPCGMLTMDLRGCMRDQNSRLRVLMKGGRRLKVGDHVINRIAAASVPTFLKLQTQALEQGEAGPELVRLESEEPIDMSMVRIDDVDGRAIGLQCVLQPLSPRILALLAQAESATDSSAEERH